VCIVMFWVKLFVFFRSLRTYVYVVFLCQIVSVF
jgi:hypothetical protein